MTVPAERERQTLPFLLMIVAAPFLLIGIVLMIVGAGLVRLLLGENGGESFEQRPRLTSMIVIGLPILCVIVGFALAFGL